MGVIVPVLHDGPTGKDQDQQRKAESLRVDLRGRARNPDTDPDPDHKLAWIYNINGTR